MLAGKRCSERTHAASRRLSLCTALMVSALWLWPALALACPPVLKSVTVQPNTTHPLAVWGLPQNVSSQFIQTSRSPEVDDNGYFPTLVTFNTLSGTDTQFLDPINFAPGIYYLHVAGHDSRCNGKTCPVVEFSEVMSFEVGQVTAAASVASSPLSAPVAHSAAVSCSSTGGGGGALPSTTGGPGPDKIRPLQNLSFGPVQDIDKLFVRARMSEAGTLRAGATVSVAGASKVYRFKAVSRSVAANRFTKLRLKLAKKKLKAVKRALKQRKRLRAKITVTATDKAGNKRSQKATIRLKN
jgi:hypothetical protein